MATSGAGTGEAGSAADVSMVIELRVHGVSGTPPEQLLDTPMVRHVAGSGRAGFYRPRLPVEQRDPRMSVAEQPVRRGPWLEGYAWGGLTSGAPLRALWLVLLPFTLINVAPRMRPRGPDLSGKAALNLTLLWFVIRLLAISMTSLLVLAVAGVGIDLYAWQCTLGATAGAPDCSAASPQWIMGPLLRLSVEHRVAVGAALPLAVVGLFWLLSQRTINNYENVTGLFKGSADAGADDLDPGLASPWMWRNEFLVRRLRHVHLQAAMTTTLWVATAGFKGDLTTWARIGALVVVAVFALVALLWPAYLGRQQDVPLAWIRWVPWAVLIPAAVAVAVALIAFHPLADPSGLKGLPDYAGTARVVFVAQIVLLILFIGCVVVMAVRGRSADDPQAPRALGNCASIMIVSLGVFLGAVFSAGVYLFAGAWLTTGSLRPGFQQVSDANQPFDRPDTVQEAARAYAVAVYLLVIILALAAVAFVVWALVRRFGTWPGPTYSAKLDAAYPKTETFDWRDDPPRAKKIANTFWLARQVDFAHRYLAGLITAGLLITLWFVFVLLDKGTPDCIRQWREYDPAPDSQAPLPCGATITDTFDRLVWTGFLSARSLEAAGAYFAVITLLLLVSLGALAYRVDSTRRSVGILWDLASFWPRAAHPLAAPCYAERSVPELCNRIRYYTEEVSAPTGVVIAAHSQGTVLGAAVLRQLATHDEQSQEKDIVPRVAFLSFGCVLRRLYSRYFPAYFATDELSAIADSLGRGSEPGVRWRNLWRYSDYLGGQVTAGPPPAKPTGPPVPGAPAVPPAPDAAAGPPAPSSGADGQIEVQFVDPHFDRPRGDVTYPKASAHSNFWADPRFAETVCELAETVRPA